MNRLLIIGAGRTTGSLVKYVLHHADIHNWFVTVADHDLDAARKRVGDHSRARAVWLDVTKANDRREVINRSDVVVSLVPSHLHMDIARDCIELNKQMITASYVTKELYRWVDYASDDSLSFMGQMGLDPGLDHMSAMARIHKIKDQGGKITSFKSYFGALLSPAYANNPWKYKFTWNPRNAVVLGKGTAQYLKEGKYKFVPYKRLFEEFHNVDIKGVGKFEAFASRDSLLYRQIYGLEDIPNIMRGTLRYSGFCRSWNALIQLGLTDGTFPILETDNLTYYSFVEAFVRDKAEGQTLKARVANLLGIDVDDKVIRDLEWLGLFSRKRIKVKNGTPALIMEELLAKKWKLVKGDKDMVLIQHEFEYELEGKRKQLTSTLNITGVNRTETAIAKLVGLPIGIFIKHIMTGTIRTTGVNIPVMRAVYEPVLAELEELGIAFEDIEKNL